MPKWMLGRALTLIGMLGIPLSGATAQSLDTGAFPSERAAREYLRQNPTGPRAGAAFLALSEFRLVRENPGLTRGQVVAGFGNTGATPARRTGPTRSPEEEARNNDPY